ncbi:MAG: YbjQ family protein [Chloroflexi bacterium]|nr:MAG: YbjQ family protein [Chloroflexota bacterium]
MIITTQDNIPGHEIVEVLGIAQGNTVRARNVGRDFLAGIKNLVGGEIEGYTQLMTEARDEAMQRMADEARGMGADAVVTVRFNTSDIMQSAAEIFVYGTAVRIKRAE